MKKAICRLYDLNNTNVGFVYFSQCCPTHPTLIQFNLYGFGKKETHAIHIHEYGDTTDGCKSLGLHYNPFKTTHGSLLYPKQNRHAGDLINNFNTDRKGAFQYEYHDELVTLYGKDSILGRSVVIHKGIDDLGQGGNKESLISGNAGERMACGIIGLMKSD